MKKILIILAVVLPLCALAQDLGGGDDPSVAPEVAAPDSTAAPAPPAVTPRHFSTTDSWRDERLAIREGNEFYADSDFHHALECYNRALEINGSSIAGRYDKALALLNLSTADNVGTSADTRPEARQLLAQVAQEGRLTHPAIAQRAFYNLGNMSYNDHQYDSAIQLYEASLRLDPDDWNCRYNLRLAQLKKQQQEQNQDQDQDDQDDQDDQQEQQQQDQQQEQEQEQQQQQQPQPEMSQSAEQILQSMQNQENATRRRVQQQEPNAARRGQPEKPW